MGNVIFTCLQTIAIPTAKGFQIDVLYVNLTNAMCLFNCIPMTFLSIWVYSNVKLDNAIRGVVTI